MRREPLPTALLLAAGLLGVGVLHLLAPPLALTWSYAHLDRHPALPWLAAALLLVLPPAVAALWRGPLGRGPAAPLAPARAAAATLVLVAVLAPVGLLWPAPQVSVDPFYFVSGAMLGGTEVSRWYLTVWTLSHLTDLARPVLAPLAVVRLANTAVAAGGLAALAGCARRLAATEREAWAITALVGSAFGVVQLVPGYLDVYPVALAATAAFLWTALRAAAGEGHPAWPLAVAALGPFWYVGLLVLAPAAAAVALVEMLRGAAGRRRAAVAVAAAVLAAGLATVPGWGRPFAWPEFLAAVRAESFVELGLSPTSSLLPPGYVATAAHAREVLHTLLLVDPVGTLLLAVAGTWCLVTGARRRPDRRLLVLAAVAVPWLAFVATMDPLFGAFADWDLFSYGTAAPALLGAWAFVAWGRRAPRLFPLLLGLALATAGVHLLARLNALDAGADRHRQESPDHRRPAQGAASRTPGAVHAPSAPTST
jgi:hypothetical protein